MSGPVYAPKHCAGDPNCAHARIGFGGVCLDCGKTDADLRPVKHVTVGEMLDRLRAGGVEVFVNGVRK